MLRPVPRGERHSGTPETAGKSLPPAQEAGCAAPSAPKPVYLPFSTTRDQMISPAPVKSGILPNGTGDLSTAPFTAAAAFTQQDAVLSSAGKPEDAPGVGGHCGQPSQPCKTAVCTPIQKTYSCMPVSRLPGIGGHIPSASYGRYKANNARHQSFKINPVKERIPYHYRDCLCHKRQPLHFAIAK